VRALAAVDQQLGAAGAIVDDEGPARLGRLRRDEAQPQVALPGALSGRAACDEERVD
jgi:hypothetical protein